MACRENIAIEIDKKVS